MRFVPYIVLLISSISFGQSGIKPLFEELPNDTVLQLSLETHTSVLPQIRMVDQSNPKKDTMPSYLEVTALADLGGRHTTEFEYRTGVGLGINSSIKNKWFIDLKGIQGIGYADSIAEPKSYGFSQKTDHFWYNDIRSRLSYTPNEVFNFQLGLDHNFIGEGNRSLFLSDYGKPYPFGQIRARFWRVEYTVIYQLFREEFNSEWKRKHGATHYVSLNATKWLNFGIFESVTFQPKDTLLNRGYDVEYLNPVIFYRPQEYALGSSDNVLLGASFSAKWRTFTFYGQFILDEFSLTEVKLKSGWWANKYGGQLGVKGKFSKDKKHFFFRTEFNVVRPYTYAHLNSGQNFGNQGSPLAHPYGANFIEILGELKIQQSKWTAKLFMSYFLQGLDKDGYSYGANVYQPYTNRPYEYHHEVGQGKGNNGFRFIVNVSYNVLKQGNLQAFIEYQYRFDSAFERSVHIPMIGLRSQLWNDYRNY